MATKRKRAGDARRKAKRARSTAKPGANAFARARGAWDELVELSRGRVRAAERAERAQRERVSEFNPADWFQRFGEDAPRRDLDRCSPRLAGELADTLEHAARTIVNEQKEAAAASAA